MRYLYLLFLINIFFNLCTASAQNIEHGSEIFKKRCALCHFSDKDQNRIGPTLHNIIGKAAASTANYSYSAAMRTAGKNGLIWTKEKLEEYLHNPHKMVPGTKMAIIFMKNQNDLDDLYAYLASIPK